LAELTLTLYQFISQFAFTLLKNSFLQKSAEITRNLFMFHKSIVMKKSFILFFLVCLLNALTGALSAQTSGVLFIFDASGSMWGKIGATAKIQIAKETMGRLSDKISASSRVGLIAYGHRSASDCNDIETLVPMGPFDKTKFNNTIKALNPKGKTPIALSINQALALIRGVSNPVTIILVSDGLETCEGNACEIVKNARASGIKITMHVVGFGIAEKDLAPLECIAQAGGGQYFPANNAGELAAALEQTVKEAPVGDAWVSVKTTLEGKLKDASVRVFKKGQAKETISGRTYESKETNPRVMQLPAGVYEIEIMPVAITGHPGIKFSDVEIKAHDTLFKNVEFEQGVVEVLVTRNGALSDALIQVFAAGTNKMIASNRSYNKPEQNPAKLKIPPGMYDIVFSSVEISGRPEIKVLKKELGSSGNLKFTHNFESGELRIGAKNDQGLVDATINIIDTKTGKSVGAGRTYQDAKNNPKAFILQPGQYKVELKSVKPAGLGTKSVTVEVTAKGSLEKIVEW
jgi:Ca-activated chloride channel homolog